VPEWFKSGGTSQTDGTNTTKSMKLLSRRSEYGGSSGRLAGGWTGLSAYKAPSLGSLQSSNSGSGRNSGTERDPIE